MQTFSLGRLQEKSLEHNDCLYLAFVLEWRVRKPPMENVPSSENYFQTNCSVIPMFLKKHLNNTRTICLNRFLQTWDIFLHTGLAELHIFFATLKLVSTIFHYF